MADQFVALFNEKREEIEKLLAMTADDKARFVMLALNAVRAFPNCTPDSRVQCIIDSASCELELGTAERLAFLIPYGRILKFTPSYVGLIRRVVDAGAAMSVFADLCYENDQVEVNFAERKLIHRVDAKKINERGKLIAAYSVAQVTRIISDFELLTLADIGAIKAAAMRIGGNKLSPAWTQFEGEMIKKSAIRRLCKRLQGNRRKVDPERLRQLDHAFELDNRDYEFKPQANGGDHETPLGAVARDIPDEPPPPEPEQERYLNLEEQDSLCSQIVELGWRVREISDVLKQYAGVEASDQIVITDLPNVMTKIEAAAKARNK